MAATLLNQNFSDDDEEDDFNPGAEVGSDDEADAKPHVDGDVEDKPPARTERSRPDSGDQEDGFKEEDADKDGIVGFGRDEDEEEDVDGEGEAGEEDEARDGGDDAEQGSEEEEEEDSDDDIEGQPSRKRRRKHRRNQFIDVEAEVDEEDEVSFAEYCIYIRHMLTGR